MNSENPFNLVNVHGGATFRSVTLALPVNQVRQCLPSGLELGEQRVTPKGTHPVIVSFNEFFRVEWSFPNPLQSLTYHEVTFSVPYAWLTPAAESGFSPRTQGPFIFFPRLLLDNWLAVLGGMFFWGLAKRIASFTVRHDTCSVSDGSTPLISLSWKAVGAQKPVGSYPHFAAVRDMLDQPSVSLVPASIGKWFVVSDFERQWDVATLRPLETSVQVDTEFVPGFTSGCYPQRGTSSGIQEEVLGSYELRAPWRMGLPFPPMLRG